MARIWITQTATQWTDIDDEDYGFLVGWQWTAHYDQRGKLYVRRSEGNSRTGMVRVYMHRVVALRAMGLPPSPAHRYVDHINRDGIDNRRANLRWATASENAKNVERLLGPYQEFYERRKMEVGAQSHTCDMPF